MRLALKDRWGQQIIPTSCRRSSRSASPCAVQACRRAAGSRQLRLLRRPARHVTWKPAGLSRRCRDRAAAPDLLRIGLERQLHNIGCSPAQRHRRFRDIGELEARRFVSWPSRWCGGHADKVSTLALQAAAGLVCAPGAGGADRNDDGIDPGAAGGRPQEVGVAGGDQVEVDELRTMQASREGDNLACVPRGADGIVGVDGCRSLATDLGARRAGGPHRRPDLQQRKNRSALDARPARR